MFAIFFAALMILPATASPSSACSARSAGDMTARERSSSKPASRSFSAVAGPTPGRSSILTSGTSSSATSIGITSSSVGTSFFLLVVFFFVFVLIVSLKPNQRLRVYQATNGSTIRENVKFERSDYACMRFSLFIHFQNFLLQFHHSIRRDSEKILLVRTEVQQHD